MIKWVALDKLTSWLNQSDTDVLCLVAPNYEPRSVLGLEPLLADLRANSERVQFGLLTLQSSSRRIEPLEYLKTANTNRLKRLIHSRLGRAPYALTVPYPNAFSEVTAQGIMRDLASGSKPPFSLVLDLTALPRKVIAAIMSVILRERQQGRLERIFLLYSWAGAYPQPRYPGDIGALVPVRSGVALSRLLGSVGAARAVVLPSRQGFESRQFIEALPPTKHVSVHLLVDRENPFHSFQVLRANTAVVNDTALSLQYYLTLQAGHEHLLQWARECPIEPDTAYLVAPFGPKLVLVSGWLALGIVQQRCADANNTVCDVVLLSGHQYNTTYSLGFDRLEAYELDTSTLTTGAWP